MIILIPWMCIIYLIVKYYRIRILPNMIYIGSLGCDFNLIQDASDWIKKNDGVYTILLMEDQVGGVIFNTPRSMVTLNTNGKSIYHLKGFTRKSKKFILKVVNGSFVRIENSSDKKSALTNKP